jgi:hypothetical protein
MRMNTMIAVRFLLARFMRLSWLILITIALWCGCGTDDAKNLDGSDAAEIEECSAPPSALEGTACESTSQYCRTTEESHVCCSGMHCGCFQELIWECFNIGCADSAEECSSICEIRPNAPFCPPSHDDATDGDSVDAAASSDTPSGH